MQGGRKVFAHHGRGVFCELMKLRGLPVERFRAGRHLRSRNKDKTDLKEGLANAGYTL